MPKAALASILAILSRIGTKPVAIEVQVGEGTRRISLSPTTAYRRKRFLVVVTCTAAVLGLASMAIPFVSQIIQRRVAERAIAALQPQVTEAASLRSRIANNRAGGDVIAAERARTGSALQVLATITELMPDDTVPLGNVASSGPAGH